MDSINTKLNDLVTDQQFSTNNSQNSSIQPNISIQNTTTTVKKISDYKLSVHADTNLDLAINLITEDNYQQLIQLLQQNNTILAKLLALPREQSPIITAMLQKKHVFETILGDAILEYSTTNPLPEYLQKDLFIYACINPTHDISQKILSLYEKTSIFLKSRQIKYLLHKSINTNNNQVLDLLIIKFIIPFSTKEKKYSYFLQYAIRTNNQKIFTFLFNQSDKYKIDLFANNILKKIIPAIISSKNRNFMHLFLYQTIKLNDYDKLWSVICNLINYNYKFPDGFFNKLPDKILLDKDTSGHTILHYAFLKNNDALILKLLELPSIQQHINKVSYFANIRHRSKYNIAEIALTNCRKQQAKDFVYNKAIKTTEKSVIENIANARHYFAGRKNQLIHSVDYLDLATSMVEQKSIEILTEVLTNLTNYSSIGVFLDDAMMFVRYNKNNGQTFCFGDENAVINIINRLIFLGCNAINLYIPVSSNLDECSKKIIIKKISYLLNTNNDSKNKMIKKEQCTIKFCFIEKNKSSESITDDTILTFGSRFLFRYHASNIQNIISLKPFLYVKSYEEICIKMDDDKQNLNSKILAINNPINSILKEEKTILPLHCGIIDNKQWFYNLLSQTIEPTKTTVLMECINTITENINQQQINHGVIYGLHHASITNANDILANWVNLLQQSSQQEDKKPIILSVLANTLVVNTKRLSTENTFVFNFIDGNYKLQTIQQAFKQKKNIIILYPCLPKVIFYHLIDQTNLPILTEGANTTSYALQQAKSYLSVLPNGRTPIPMQMGDPLQALLIEATSYKITLNPEYIKLTTELFKLVSEERYQDAVDFIEELIDKLENLVGKPYKNKMILFFFCKEEFEYEDTESAVTYRDKITVLSLISKGSTLSKSEKELLLQILNPDMQSVVNYIKQCKDPDSLISWHAKLMQHHVNLEINNTVDMSLYKFFKNK